MRSVSLIFIFPNYIYGKFPLVILLFYVALSESIIRPLLSEESLLSVQDLLRNVTQDLFVEGFRRLSASKEIVENTPILQVGNTQMNPAPYGLSALPHCEHGIL